MAKADVALSAQVVTDKALLKRQAKEIEELKSKLQSDGYVRLA